MAFLPTGHVSEFAHHGGAFGLGKALSGHAHMALSGQGVATQGLAASQCNLGVCCKECQVEHWKAGHKHECKKLTAQRLNQGAREEDGECKPNPVSDV